MLLPLLGPSVPQDAPAWVKSAVKMLESEDWGATWKSAVHAWYRYESEKHAFEGNLRLGCTHQPPITARWIQLARPEAMTHEKAGTITTKNINVQFWKWWANLQPEWRVISHETTSRKVAGGWAALDKPGVNGFLSVVATLFLWHRFGTDMELASWTRAVEDVHWVLDQLASAA